MIEIKNLSKKFEDIEVLKNINLNIRDGDIHGLVGVSGAGKSTLLRCINGLINYDSGSISVDGVVIDGLNNKELRHLQKEIAMIFQHFQLMSRKSVYENIAFPMKCWRYSKDEIEKTVMELSEIVGIQDKLNQKPNTLSGGQKQRVAIARALAMNPRILLCDEATSALDPITTQSILELLKRINEQLNVTIILVTHQMSVVREICDNVSLLENGELVDSGPVEKIFLEQPYSFRKFLGEKIVIPKTGKNLQIRLFDDNKSKYILSKIGRELGVDYTMISGKMEQYGNRKLGIIVLNFKESDIGKVESYLTENGISWKEYEDI